MSRAVSIVGLSPRVRGNLQKVTVLAQKSGTIPACAGKPRKAGERPDKLRVYPRVCGETEECLTLYKPSEGLSPRVRGNHAAADFRIGDFGSIPACAGKPSKGHRKPSAIKVYPRVCGETIAGDDERLSVKGLSPRVRGNPHARC